MCQFPVLTFLYKVSSIIPDFSHLKMLGHVYVVEDAKDLAQIVRDVTRYGGAYRPEVKQTFFGFAKAFFSYSVSRISMNLSSGDRIGKR